MIPFKNILIPVDSFENSYASVEKALELCVSSETTIHLVKIIRKKTLLGKIISFLTWQKKENVREQKKEGREELRKIKTKIAERHKVIRIILHIMVKKSLPIALKKYFVTQKIDLVITTHCIDNATNHFFSHPFFCTISKKTGIPVLSVLDEYPASPAKSILIPISGFIQENKLQVALEIAKKYNTQIHIVTILDDSETDVKQHIDAFYYAYKILSEYGYPPQYKILKGHKKNETLLSYAKQVHASMIFETRDKESGSSAYHNQKISGILHPLSGVEILTIRGNLKTSA